MEKNTHCPELDYKNKGWIDVAVKLPNRPSFVIVCKNNNLVVGMFFTADGKFLYGDQDQTSQITHWMELPAPPQKESVPDLSKISEEMKEATIKEVTELSSKALLTVFLGFGLKTHIEMMVVNNATKQEYVLTFETVERFKEHRFIILGEAESVEEIVKSKYYTKVLELIKSVLPVIIYPNEAESLAVKICKIKAKKEDK